MRNVRICKDMAVNTDKNQASHARAREFVNIHNQHIDNLTPRVIRLNLGGEVKLSFFVREWLLIK